MGAEPRTAAGRRLLEAVAFQFWSAPKLAWLWRNVLAIEAEAVAAYKAELSEKVRALRGIDPFHTRGDHTEFVARAAVLALLEAEPPHAS
jgi:hypothetical protein